MDRQTNHLRPKETLIERFAEASNYLMRQGRLHIALAYLTRDLKEHGIDYMVIGALALFEYGYARLTEDIDLVMTREGLEDFHRELIGSGLLSMLRRIRLPNLRVHPPAEFMFRN